MIGKSPKGRTGRSGRNKRHRLKEARAGKTTQPKAIETRRPGLLVSLIFPVLIAAAGLIAYHNSFSGAYVLDDDKHILNKGRIKSVFPLSETMRGRRPIVDLTLAINMELTEQVEGKDPDPTGFHVFNITVHLLAGLTLFGIVRRTLSLKEFRERAGPSGPWLALAIATIWVVHPLQTQSVTYIIQRGESLTGLFYLLTLYCVLRGSESSRSWLWYVCAVLSSALGMGTKGVMVTAPVVVFFFDWLLLTRSPILTLRRRWPLYTGLAATWIILVVVGLVGGVLNTSAKASTVGFGFAGTTPMAYALTQLGVVAQYVKLSFWPHPLCLDYNWPLAKNASQIAFSSVYVPMLTIGPLIYGTIWGLLRRRWVGFAGLWFFLILAPTSSIIPIKDALFEHRMYLPLAAIIAVVVIGVHVLIESVLRGNAKVRRFTKTGLVIAVVALATYGTVQRNEDYSTTLGMWNDVLSKQPQHPRAHLGRGTALVKEGKKLSGLNKKEQAREFYADAVGAFTLAAQYRPTYAEAFYNLGTASDLLANTEQAETALRKALELSPSHVRAHYNLANVLKKQRRYDEAIVEYRHAVRIRHTHVSARINLANTLRMTQRLDEAVKEYLVAIKLGPKYAPRKSQANAHANLAATYEQQGLIDNALNHAKKAIKIYPSHKFAQKLLKRLLQQDGG